MKQLGAEFPLAHTALPLAFFYYMQLSKEKQNVVLN